MNHIQQSITVCLLNIPYSYPSLKNKFLGNQSPFLPTLARRAATNYSSLTSSDRSSPYQKLAHASDSRIDIVTKLTGSGARAHTPHAHSRFYKSCRGTVGAARARVTQLVSRLNPQVAKRQSISPRGLNPLNYLRTSRVGSRDHVRRFLKTPSTEEWNLRGWSLILVISTPTRASLARVRFTFTMDFFFRERHILFYDYFIATF